ncbi:MAG: hypothetical protein ACRD2U_09610 [Terriglobales bacterium]
MRDCRMLLCRSAAAIVALSLITSANGQSDATPANRPPTSQPVPNIANAWDGVLKDTSSQAPPPVLTPAQTPYESTPAAAFLNHFFANTRTEYLRTQTFFSGLPTATGVIDAVPGSAFNPAGTPYPPAFQSSTNIVSSLLNWGTRGWLSDRVNSNFSFAYSQGLTNVTDASPQLSILNTFGSDRRLELVSGYIDINGRAADGLFAGTSLRLGRQAIYGAELAEMDGASFTVTRPRYSWTLYAGRRFTFFSDPDQRAMGGGNFLFRLSDNSTLEYETFYYIKGSNLFRYRHTIGDAWLFVAAFRMVGSSPTDFSADVAWNPKDGKTSLRLNFAQKITDKDYFFDYAYDARDLDPYNPLRRLNLEALHPHTQFVVDVSRAINSRLRLGGDIWVRRLDDRQDAGPFDTSFQDYRTHAQIFLWSRTDLLAEYHQRNSDDRTGSAAPTQFDDLSTTGETRVQDLSLEIGRSFVDGRLNLRAGGFYRQLNFRDLFTVISDARDKGVLANASFTLDSHTRLYLDYDLDTDYAVFRPDIQNSQTFRFGMAWRY